MCGPEQARGKLLSDEWVLPLAGLSVHIPQVSLAAGNPVFPNCHV